MTPIASNTAAASAGATTSGSSVKLFSDFTGFLTLLTTQLQNQDPLQPMDTDKFTSQLVQFASVEQQLSTNKKLDTLVGSASSANQAAAVGYLGTNVNLKDALTQLGANGASVTYSLAAPATDVKLAFYDSANKLVASSVGGLAKGSNTARWDGIKADGTRADPGTYRVEVSARNESGQAITSTVDSQGTVDAVTYGTDGITLSIGGTTIPLSSVSKVTLPAL